ncbi:MAG: hypothetical protein SP1CHLAM54_00780 [Chlamydiia bacterium]|nr:hypothetical protein [Chlamydiia bacterium]MCH9615000.1 hypothetical protein [Chlamydiia bacterium]MCH9629950.1 hypothetical protein [Chlamydiia bacterium]
MPNITGELPPLPPPHLELDAALTELMQLSDAFFSHSPPPFPLTPTSPTRYSLPPIEGESWEVDSQPDLDS